MEALLIGRIVERLLITVFAGATVVMGWNLFRVGVVMAQTGEIEQWKFKVKLTKVGPGIFFALFGTLVLIHALRSPMQFEVSSDGSWKTKGVLYLLGPNDADQRDAVRALNTVLSAVTPDKVRAGNIAASDLAALMNANASLAKVRNNIITEKFGARGLAIWNQYGRDFMSDEKNVPQEHRQVLRDIEPWITECVKP